MASVRHLTALPPAASRNPLTGLPLLLASSYRRSDSPTGDLHPIDMPMPDVHKPGATDSIKILVVMQRLLAAAAQER